MSASNPSRVFTLTVPASGEFVQPEPLPFPANVHITMAAIDPTAKAEGDGPKLATLKIVHRPVATEFDEQDYRGGGYSDSDEDSEEDNEESEDEDKDAKESKVSRKKAAAKDIQKLLDEATAMDVDEAKVNKKAKAVNAGSEDDEDEDSEDDEEDFIEESVICTLDPTKLYQQPLNIVIADGEEVLFKSNGAYTVYLSGNYVMPDSTDSDEDEDEDYDLSPDEEEDYYLNGIGESDEESDDLDDLEDPRVTELEDDEVAAAEAPKLSKKEKKAAAKAAVDVAKKVEKAVSTEPASKKRGADEMEVDVKPVPNGAATKSKPAAAPETPALSKKQLKKLKANSGDAAPAPSPSSEKKKVQFASELEQGPTPNGTKSTTPAAASPSAAPKPPATAKPVAAPTPSSMTRTVKGVEIYDKKIGTSGHEAKNGQKVSMRYVGKLTNGKVFDSNTKGKPFTFKLGSGEVIKGWDIGIAGMKIGGERKITIPAGLAYGTQAQPGIPKNSTLVFEVKLLEIK